MDLIVIISIVLIAAAPLLLFRKTDNTKWLKLKQVAEERLTRYEGEDKKIVEMLVNRFGELCLEIAAGTSYWDSKHGQILANEATRITMQLKRRGFMKKTRKETTH